MPYNNICQWCMRYDCKEKGGNIKQCPAGFNKSPNKKTVKYHKKRIKR